MMRRVVIALFLAAIWLAEWGTLDLGTFVGGFVLAFGILLLLRRLYDPKTGGMHGHTRIRPLAFAFLLLAFLYEVAVSAFSVLKEIVRPRLRIEPGVVAVPLDVTTDVQVTVLANMVSLTPGTLSIDVSADGKRLYVHALNVEGDGEAVRQSIKKRLERRVLRALPGHR